MKTLTTIVVLFLSIVANSQTSLENRNFGIISIADSSFGVYTDPENYNLEHRFFGYEKPDTTSIKLIVYSAFTDDIENNPHQCSLGAYYSTDMNDLEFDGVIKFISEDENFVKMKFIKGSGEGVVFYFEQEWIKFYN